MVPFVEGFNELEQVEWDLALFHLKKDVHLKEQLEQYDLQFFIRFVRGSMYEENREKRTQLILNTITDTLKWRKECGVDDILSRDLPNIAVFRENVWPMRFIGFDKEGFATVLVRLKDCDWEAGSAVIAKDRLIEYFTYHQEVLLRRLKAMNTSSRCNIIFDFGGLSWKDYKLAYSFGLAQVFQLWAKNYPEGCKAFYLINCTVVFKTLFRFVKPWVEPDTILKINVFGASPAKYLPIFEEQGFHEEFMEASEYRAGPNVDFVLPTPEILHQIKNATHEREKSSCDNVEEEKVNSSSSSSDSSGALEEEEDVRLLNQRPIAASKKYSVSGIMKIKKKALTKKKSSGGSMKKYFSRKSVIKKDEPLLGRLSISEHQQTLLAENSNKSGMKVCPVLEALETSKLATDTTIPTTKVSQLPPSSMAPNSSSSMMFGAEELFLKEKNQRKQLFGSDLDIMLLRGETIDLVMWEDSILTIAFIASAEIAAFAFSMYSPHKVIACATSYWLITGLICEYSPLRMVAPSLYHLSLKLSKTWMTVLTELVVLCHAVPKQLDQLMQGKNKRDLTKLTMILAMLTMLASITNFNILFQLNLLGLFAAVPLLNMIST